MSAFNHTAPVNGASNDISTIANPLGQLDAAIGDLPGDSLINGPTMLAKLLALRSTLLAADASLTTQLANIIANVTVDSEVINARDSGNTGGTVASLLARLVAVAADAYHPMVYDATGDGVADDYTALNAVKTAISTDDAWIIIDRPYRVATTLAFPANVHFEFVGAGQLLPDADKAVQILGTIQAGAHQIFGGSGRIYLGATACREILPEWWGAVPADTADLANSVDSTAAIQEALDQVQQAAVSNHHGTILLSGMYRITSQVYGTSSLLNWAIRGRGGLDGIETGTTRQSGLIYDGTSDGSQPLISIVGGGVTATATTGTHGYSTNDKIEIAGTTNFDGVYTITVTDTDEFTFSHSYSGTDSAQGSCCEVASSYAVTGTSGTGSVATLTVASHTYIVGDIIHVTGAGNYNGIHVVTAVAATTISYASTATGNTTGTVYKTGRLAVLRLANVSGVHLEHVTIDANYKASYGVQYLSTGAAGACVYNYIGHGSVNHARLDGIIIGDDRAPAVARQAYNNRFERLYSRGNRRSFIHVNEDAADMVLIEYVGTFNDEGGAWAIHNSIWFERAGQNSRVIGGQLAAGAVDPNFPRSGWAIRNDSLGSIGLYMEDVWLDAVGAIFDSAGAPGGTDHPLVLNNCHAFGEGVTATNTGGSFDAACLFSSIYRRYVIIGGEYHANIVAGGASVKKNQIYSQGVAFGYRLNFSSANAFNSGDTVTGDTSGASGVVAGVGSDFVILREESGFISGEQVNSGANAIASIGTGLIDEYGKRTNGDFGTDSAWSFLLSQSGAVRLSQHASMHHLQLNGNVTSINAVNGRRGETLTVVIEQDSTGGRTVTWGSQFTFGEYESNPQPASDTDSVTAYTFVWDNGHNVTSPVYRCVSVKRQVSRVVGVSTSTKTVTKGDTGRLYFLDTSSVGGTVTVTLPSYASAPGVTYKFVVNHATNQGRIQPAAGENFLGQTGNKYLILTGAGTSVEIVSTNGSAWMVVSAHVSDGSALTYGP